MKENVTLSDLKAGDKLICTNLEYIQRFKVGKEYEVKEGEFGLFIENEHKVPIYIELNIKAFSECFSLLTPQQPERLLSEADKEEKPFSVFLNEQNNYTLAYKEGTDNEALIAYSKDDEMLVDAAITLNNILNRHFKLISQTAQEEFRIPVTESEVEQFEKEHPIDVHLSESKSEEMRKNILRSAQEEVKEEELTAEEFFERLTSVPNYVGENIYVKLKDGYMTIERISTSTTEEVISLLQQEVEKLRELLKESKRFCGGSLQAKIDNQLNK